MTLPGFSSPFTSLDMPFFWRSPKLPYPEKLMPLPTNGIVLNLPMEKFGNCHNVFSEIPAGSMGAPAGGGMELVLLLGDPNRWQGRERKTHNNLAEAATFRESPHGVEGYR
jgi:hypothetical protein